MAQIPIFGGFKPLLKPTFDMQIFTCHDFLNDVMMIIYLKYLIVLSSGRRHAAVLVLREIAFCMPTFFFQNVQQFFDVIFHAIYDPKPQLRESAANALRMALVVTSQRETSSQTREGVGGHSSWYQHCFMQVVEGLEDTTPAKDRGYGREDRIHGSLLVLSELLRCSNANWEMVTRELEELSGACPPEEEDRSSYFSMGKMKRQYKVGMSDLTACSNRSVSCHLSHPL